MQYQVYFRLIYELSRSLLLKFYVLNVIFFFYYYIQFLSVADLEKFGGEMSQCLNKIGSKRQLAGQWSVFREGSRDVNPEKKI